MREVATILLASRFIADTISFAALGHLVLATLSCGPRSFDPRGEQLEVIATQRSVFRLTVLMVGLCSRDRGLPTQTVPVL
jgi:hypothetical protein